MNQYYGLREHASILPMVNVGLAEYRVENAGPAPISYRIRGCAGSGRVL